MTVSRQVRRAGERKSKKQQSAPELLREAYTALSQVVSEMHVSMNALYELLIDKGLITHDEFLEKHNVVVAKLTGKKGAGQ